MRCSGEKKLFWISIRSTLGCFTRPDACVVPWKVRADVVLSILMTDFIYVSLEDKRSKLQGMKKQLLTTSFLHNICP